MSSFLQSKLDEICGMMKKNNYMPPKKMDDFQNDIDRVVSALAMLVLVKESKTTLQKHHMRCLAASLFLTCDTIQECKHMKKAIEENFFDTNTQELVKTVENVCNHLIRSDFSHKEYWLYCLPLLCLLSGDTEPPKCKDMVTKEIVTKEWWGIHNISIHRCHNYSVDIFPKASSLLGPYFNIYPKLSRALIYPINPYSDFTVQFFKSNHKLPVYICYARLLKDISDSKYHLSQKCCSILELFDEMNMKSVSEETQSENEHTLLMNEMRTHAYKVAKELVIAVAKEKKLEMEKILIVAKFFVSEVNMTKLLLERSGSNGEKLTTDELMEDIKKVSSLLGISMSCDLPNERIGLKRELMKWSELAKVAFIENKLQETWIESTLSVLKKCIEKANTDTTINIYQWANDDKISKHIQELVTQIIYTILEDYKPSSERKPILQLKSDNLERYTQLISQFIIRLWSKLRGKKDDDKFKLLLQEKAWPRCIELSLDVNVSPEAATCLKDAKTLIQHGIEDLYKCDVEMGSITCMLKNETEFIMFCESIHKDEQYTKSAEIPNIEDIHKCITAKKTEYEMLQNFKHSLKLCSEMLSKLNKEVVIPAEVNARNTDYKRVQSYIQRLSNDIFNGTISISQLQILVHHKDAFAKLWKTADKYQGTDECKITVEDMTKCITTREKEVKALLHFKSKVQLVIGLFQKSNHDFTVLHRILETLEDPQSHICDMFDVKVFDKLSESPFITNSHTLDENNSFPQLPKSVIIMINEIPCSKLVVQMFDDTNKYVQTAPPSLNMPTTSIQSPESIQSITENVIPTATISSELVQEMSTENVEDQVTTTSFDVEAVDRLATEVWPYVKSRLKKLKDEISSHNILLSDVHYYFRAYQHNINSLHDQLVPIVGKQGEKEEIAKFCATVHDYFSLEEVKKAAAVVKKCKDALEVNGDFTSITIIDEQDTKREGKYLKSINDSVVDTRNVLRTFTDERLECLQTFTMCKEIISWSIEGLRDASELNNFTTLLLMAVGDSPTDIGKVTTYQSALNGYSPLLFQLPTTAGWTEFNNVCNSLWKALSSDNKLPEKLKLSQEHLHVLKRLKDVHGPSEVKCVEQMNAVNSRGIYEVGNIGSNLKDADHVILRLSEESNTDDNIQTEWTLTDLNDLRSKIILVSGKGSDGKEGSERFLAILEGVSRLAGAFVKLTEAGDLFYRDMKTTVSKLNQGCGETDMIMDDSVTIKLSKNTCIKGAGDPLKLVCELYMFMENCIEKWSSVVEQARNTFRALNNFTTKQLNIMRQEIVYLLPYYTGTETISDELLSLLHCLNNSVNKEMLSDVLVKCLKEIKEDPDLLLTREIDTHDCDLKQLKVFLKRMKRFPGITDQIAKAAFQACDGDIEKGEEWCIENITMEEENMDEIDRLYSAFIKTPYADIDDLTSDSALVNIVRKSEISGNNGGTRTSEYESHIVQELEKTWNQYQHKNYDEEEQEHISIEFLGLILDALKNKEKQADLQPDVTPDIKQGKPNLFIVPERTIITTCLSIYYHRGKLEFPDAGEVLVCTKQTTSEEGGSDARGSQFWSYLPITHCVSPSEVFADTCRNTDDRYVLLDEIEFFSEKFRRIHHYLNCFYGNETMIIKFSKAEYPIYKEDPSECLDIIMRYCGVQKPLWSVIHQFVSFLNEQLVNWEESPFCGKLASEDLPGFSRFALHFMIVVAQDFATPSLEISDESIGAMSTDEPMYQVRRRWEQMAHPYIFFNKDGTTMTFHGFKVGRDGSLVSPTHPDIVVPGIILEKQLQTALEDNGAKFSYVDQAKPKFDFDRLPRKEKVRYLCRVLGMSDRAANDPDPTYELITDNVTKMMGILLRFRCDTPVVIMGETGCGKTRLVKYLCALMGGRKRPRNFMVMKVHGGTTSNNIVEKVKEAEKLAEENEGNFGIDTVLFFDEANTTDALGVIKEIMTDSTLEGRPLSTKSLKFVAACNPYRKHTEEAIKTLEAAGLGFRVHADDSEEKMGTIPMRHLVYRVQQLPPRLMSFVWDFGQLSDEVEQAYIASIVKNNLMNSINRDKSMIAIERFLLITVLSASQRFMRSENDECRFVSLRDIERTVIVYKWFVEHYELFASEMYRKEQEQRNVPVFTTFMGRQHKINTKIRRCIILALGVCYHACLTNRLKYREHIAKSLEDKHLLPEGQLTIQKEISWCQDIFVDSIKLNPNIARNEALKENVFMITVCLQLKIPIFVVGKPGSSKSLAKTIVDNNMKGKSSSSNLFRKMKGAQMWSCQCSQHSTPENIIETFDHCAAFQKQQCQDDNPTGGDQDENMGVVVLDEVGLAEDSPLMPLKTLHPLLENGCIEDIDDPPAWRKVAFMGLSNWSLDPAKMNRGVFVVRDVPNIQELERSACDIASNASMENLIHPMAEAYLDLFQKCAGKREYFGLRDFYCLVKMVSSVAETEGRCLTWEEMRHCVSRNFGGHEGTEAVTIFEKLCRSFCNGEEDTYYLNRLFDEQNETQHISSVDLIRSNLLSEGSTGTTRYLLLMTKNSAAYDILRNMKQDDGKPFLDHEKTLVIYGSNFKNDQAYSQVCRNIKRIKICMETGHPVILINAEVLYESLYDTMNQYYIEYGELRYVNLGLGTHRFNALVHKDFRLVVIAERDVVLQTYPIPLINRLEKHYIVVNNVLTTEELALVEQLRQWTDSFVTLRQQVITSKTHNFTKSEAFIGYFEDAVSTIVHDVSTVVAAHNSTKLQHGNQKEVLDLAKKRFIQSCTPDAIVRLTETQFPDNPNSIFDMYFIDQCHTSLSHFLADIYETCGDSTRLLAQVTTHGKLLTDALQVVGKTTINHRHIFLVNLQQFGSEQEFRTAMSEFYRKDMQSKHLLVLQCASGRHNLKLVPFARFLIQDERRNTGNNYAHLVLVVQLSRIGGDDFLGFQADPWITTHIDDLRPPTGNSPDMGNLISNSVSDLFSLNDEDTFDSIAVLKMCIHGAMSLIDWGNDTGQEIESSEMSTTTTYIRKMQDLLEVREQSSLSDFRRFPDVLRKRMHLLLHEVDQCQPNNGKSWAKDVAMQAHSLQEGGTFRKTLVLKICELVTPILAELITYCSRNNNLTILHSSPCQHWIHKFWLYMFNDPIVTQCKVADPPSSEKRALVLHDGPNDMSNKWKLPFSWVIYDFLESQMSNAALLQSNCSHFSLLI
ncbi:E3 ubiquitin-protein ligase rnf213-alpha-like [Saccoglossus kowalevskii]